MRIDDRLKRLEERLGPHRLRLFAFCEPVAERDETLLARAGPRDRMVIVYTGVPTQADGPATA
jgi:hypothetical protein